MKSNTKKYREVIGTCTATGEVRTWRNVWQTQHEPEKFDPSCVRKVCNKTPKYFQAKGWTFVWGEWKEYEREIQSKGELSKKRKEYYLNNKDEIKQKNNNNYHKTKGCEKKKAVRRAYQAKKMKEDPLFAVGRNIRWKICDVIKKRVLTKRNSLRNVLGCSFEEFKIHIETQFEVGMTWENYGGKDHKNGWHIDHIVPLNIAKNIEDVERLNHYTNLRPMWGIDNIKKGTKLDFLKKK